MFSSELSVEAKLGEWECQTGAHQLIYINTVRRVWGRQLRIVGTHRPDQAALPPFDCCHGSSTTTSNALAANFKISVRGEGPAGLPGVPLRLPRRRSHRAASRDCREPPRRVGSFPDYGLGRGAVRRATGEHRHGPRQVRVSCHHGRLPRSVDRRGSPVVHAGPTRSRC